MAAAAAAISVAGPALASTVIFQNTGADSYFNFNGISLPGAGTYTIELTSSAPIDFFFGGTYTEHWDVFFAPAPKPHSQNIEGNDGDIYSDHSGNGTYGFWTFTVPKTLYSFFDSDIGYYDAYSIPVGTPLYLETKFENAYLDLEGEDFSGGTFNYSLTVTQLSAVPEPATWAMMIAGFGMAGTALRTRRRLTA
ncbi:hypothetical protein ASE02_10455 [Phenylobacterium sp. Root700]|nr:hypothetical protein ASE02_10455 [Phenylobacterium sp. Root700]